MNAIADFSAVELSRALGAFRDREFNPEVCWTSTEKCLDAIRRYCGSEHSHFPLIQCTVAIWVLGRRTRREGLTFGANRG